MVDAVYIHIPFCKSICTYCDFCKFLYNDEWVNAYLQKLELEVKDRYMDEVIKTIYIGGGTPSILKKNHLDKLFKIISVFKTSHDLEFTFECNLEDLTEELIMYLKNHQVNRISIGVESFDEENLKLMNRHMDYQNLSNTLDLLRKNGINNINLDLMYALPNEEFKTLKNDLKKVLKLKPTHISTYSLILEEHTFLSINNEKQIPEDIELKMYDYIVKTLKKNGYNHYEVSNFSLPGYESKHNLTYWQNREYYGFGAGASGYVEGIRYDNTRSLSKYIEADIFSKKELLSKNDIMDYHIILGLRLMKGINVKEFNELYNVDIFAKYPLNGLIKYGDIIYKDGYIFINPDKIYLMNEILNKCV